MRLLLLGWIALATLACALIGLPFYLLQRVAGMLQGDKHEQ
jgi:hypothetical protein